MSSSRDDRSRPNRPGGRPSGRHQSPERGPIWARPQPGRRQPRFTREQLAETALRIADEEGFDAVSMRRIAQELGAGTMTLYHYVRTKQDLITLMHDAMMAEIVVDEGVLSQGWRIALTAIATASKNSLLRHPWAHESMRGGRVGPNAMRHFDQSVRATEGLGLTQPQRFELMSLVDDYAFGYALRHNEDALAERGRSAEEVADERRIALQYMKELMASGEYPGISEWTGDEPEREWATLDAAMAQPERFERGLAALLDGAQRLFNLPG